MLDTVFKNEPFRMTVVNQARQNCKPKRLFVDCTVAIACGRRHCETKHENVEMVPRTVAAGYYSNIIVLYCSAGNISIPPVKFSYSSTGALKLCCKRVVLTSTFMVRYFARVK